MKIIRKSPYFTSRNTNGNKACACYYIQVGGFADGAADAAPSPARYRARAPKQAHASATENNPSTYQGSRIGKLPEKRGLRRRQGDGGQGAPLTRLRCPVVPAARKLVFIPLAPPLFVFHFALKVHQQLFVLHANVFRAVIQFLCRSLLGKPSDIQLVIHFV